MTDTATSRFAAFCMRRRWAVIIVIAAGTVVFGYFAAHIPVKTVFSDMVPTGHPWIQINNEYKDTFGGPNVISIMVQARKGTIFQPEILQSIQGITRNLREVHGVNPSSITSLASKKLKTIVANSEVIKTIPLMWPELPKGRTQIKQLKTRVKQNPLVYGRYVSRDLDSALITFDFYSGEVQNEKIFHQVNDLLKQYSHSNIKTYVVGQPILYGWVRHYLPQTSLIAVLTIALLAVLLFLLNRSYRGTVLPLVAGGVGAVWAVGIGELLGYNFDPLIAVVALLITARSISHSVQLVTRFDDIYAVNPGLPAKEVARRSLREMFRPGSVGVLADACAILVVLLTPIPFLQKVSIIGAVWVGTIFVSAIILTPVLLSFLKTSNRYAHRLNLGPPMHWLLDGCFRLCVGRRSKYVIVGCSVIIFLLSGYAALHVTVGDASPGSPILRQDSTYNHAAAEINSSFLGSNRMFIVVDGKEANAVKRPNVLKTMAFLERKMRIQPEVGGAFSLADAVASTNQALHGGSPRYYAIGGDKAVNAQLLYLYFSGSSQSTMARYTDLSYQDAAVHLLFHNHTGKTIRTAFHQVRNFIDNHPMEDASFELAGGLVGVKAAVNDVLLQGQMEAIALGLLVVVLCAMAVYRSSAAGIYFMTPVLLSNTLTFAYMWYENIGLNINTVPVVALGIGLGVDYSFYIADGIREEVVQHGNVLQAMKDSLHSAGRGVLITGITVVATVILWMFSSLRFQAEMAKLIALWLSVSAISALILMPALAYIFQPKFIFGERKVDE